MPWFLKLRHTELYGLSPENYSSLEELDVLKIPSLLLLEASFL